MSIEWETVSPAPPPQPGDAGEILRDALSACGRLSALLESAATADERILLLVNDGQRSTQTRPALGVLAELVGGMGPDVHRDPCHPPRFRAIVAAGAHRFSAEQRHGFERATFAECGLSIENVAWHDGLDSGSLVHIAGVRMHRWLTDSRFLLPIGSVEPHYFAGVTGPHKTLTIGCMSFEDIERNHAAAMSPSSDILCLRGNPVFDDIVQIVRRLESGGKTVCAVGQVVCGDALLAAVVGDPLEVVEALLPTVHRTYVRRVDQPVDVLRLRVRSPLSCSLYQADKALKNNHRAVRDGGGIVLEAECPEGIGPDAFMDLLRRSSDYASAQQIVAEEGYRLGDHKAVKLQHLMDPACRGVRLALVSPHVSKSGVQGTGIELFAEVQSALRWLARVITGPLERGLVVEDAGTVTCCSHAIGSWQ